MNYKYKKTRENGDATSNYDLIGEFPVKFVDFFRWVLLNDDSFRIQFRASNKCYGGWPGNIMEVLKHKEKWYWERLEPEDWFNEIRDKNITKCWASGGWGQMSYICTFEEVSDQGVGVVR